MQNSHFATRQILKKVRLLILAGISFILLYSCSDNKKKEPAAALGPSCVTLTSSQINDAWVTPGYTTPGNRNLIKWVRVYTTWNGMAGSDFRVTVTGIRADFTEIAGSSIPLTSGAACAVSLPANISVGKNSFLLTSLDILEANGTLKSDFNFVKLAPQAWPDNTNYMNYSVDVVSGGGTVAKGGSLPCPPCIYCQPPCPIEPSDSLPPNDTSKALIKNK
jgi:hypothetical protein